MSKPRWVEPAKRVTGACAIFAGIAVVVLGVFLLCGRW